MADVVILRAGTAPVQRWQIAAIAAILVLTMAGCGAKPGAPSRQVLFERAAQGKLSGEEAIQLAPLLRDDAFRRAVATETASRDAPITTQPRAAARERAAMDAAPRVSRRRMMTIARQSFAESAAALLRDPDPRTRAAVLQLRGPETQAAGIDALWAIAKEGGGQSSAIWRACGALLLATDDRRAITALENARALNPQDKGLWRLLSHAYARKERVRDAAVAALVGEGIDAASTGDWRAAARYLDLALPLVVDAPSRGFVLGLRGDAAAAVEDWDGAQRAYRAALDAHDAEKNIAALSLDSSRLARAQLKQGDGRRACATLRRARTQGAAVTEAELSSACGAAAPR